MIKQFFKDSFIYTIPSVFSKGISFLLLPLYTRVLSPSDFGSFDLIIVFSAIINMIITLEISQGVARFYSEENDIKIKRKYASSSLWFLLLCHSLFFSIAFIFSGDLATFIFEVKGKELLIQLALIFIFSSSLFSLITNQLRWGFQSINFALVSILMSSTTAIFSIFFAYILDWGLAGILGGMILGNFSGIILGLWYLRNIYRLDFSFILLNRMIKFSFPLVFSSLALWVSMYVDRIMIKSFMTLDDVGIYATGFKIASSISVILIGLNTSFTPLIFKNYKKKNTPIEISIMFRTVVAASVIVYLIISLFSDIILKIFTTELYFKSGEPLVFLIPAVLISGLQFFAPGISIAKKTHYFIYVFVLGGLLNTILNYILIPQFGILGAAISTLLGNLSIFMMLMILSQRLYYVPHKWFQILFFFILSILIVNFVLDLNLIGLLKILTNTFSILFLVGMMFLLKLITVSEIKLLINKVLNKLKTFDNSHLSK